eukprot:gnl/TRDRNA2_/TRDRNA2_38153_c0_seq1.p1 gnl/TRDRNA2_/TRDRNA2_38153_c0~~gnl/TRDRNA2_/TRDRNA2_38153_c0_seq1.p1  ORF type:complete len:500 (+),score=136.04 gnl/TRDRNA2_/TRDRNA2_38153_c0_seq1:150-1502(+)
MQEEASSSTAAASPRAASNEFGPAAQRISQPPPEGTENGHSQQVEDRLDADEEANYAEEVPGAEEVDGEVAAVRNDDDDAASEPTGFRPQPPPGEKPAGRRPISAGVARYGSPQHELSHGDTFSTPEMASISPSPGAPLPAAEVDEPSSEPLGGSAPEEGASSAGMDTTDMPPGGHNPELPMEALQMDSIEWRREYNIRRREEAWRQRADAMLMQKRVTWEVHRLEKQNRIAASREAAARCALELRIREENEQVEREYKTRCRDIQIERRYNAWTKRVAEEATQKVEEARQIEEAKSAALTKKKEQLWEEAREAAQNRAEVARRQAKLDTLREKEISHRHQERETTAAANAHRLKQEAHEKQQLTSASYPVRPKSTRCCLVLPEKGRTEAEKDREAVRSANLARKEQKRNQEQVARYTALKEKDAKEGLLVRFKGPTEHAILLGQRSIFQ